MKYVYLVWKNLARKKVRTTLTILSIVVAFILYGLLTALNQAFTLGADIAGADRLIAIHKVSLIQSMPESYVQRVAQIEGVKTVTHATWFGGYYQDPKNMFAQFPTDAAAYFKIYPELELPAEQLKAWQANRIGAVIGAALAKRFGWKIGDRIPLVGSIYPHSNGNYHWEFEVSGVFSADDTRFDTSYMLFHYDYFDEARDFGKGEIGWLIFSIHNAQQASAIAQTVDAMFANSPAETKTSTEKAFAESFAKQFGDIGMITTLILSAVFFTMLLVTGNTMAQAVRERIPEMAVLKTIGFADTTMLFLVLSESVLLAAIGGAFGLGINWILLVGMASAISGFLPGLGFTAVMFVQGLGLALIFGALAGLLPAWQAKRLSIVNALGRH
jgi:putative ABC transport system permease protein